MVHKEILFIIKLLKGEVEVGVESIVFVLTSVDLFSRHLYLCFVQVEVSSGGC